MSTFVSVGNATQPFSRLLGAVAGIAAQLPQPVIIQYGSEQGFTAPNCQCVDYLTMEDFACHVAAAGLLILHAGAGSVIHAVRAGKVPVVVPRRSVYQEHVDDHQVEFARELDRLGRIVVCNNAEKLLEAVMAAQALQALAGKVGAELPLVSTLQLLLKQHNTERDG